MAFDTEYVGRIRQCPRCELRFLDEWELEDHLASDHDLGRITHVPGAHFDHGSPH